MSDLNQFAISRILGSVMKHGKRPSFGPLGLLHAQSQAIAHYPKLGEQIALAPRSEKLILRAFEETRKGYTLERVLADPLLTGKMLRRAKEHGVEAEDHAVILRLFRIRKSPKGQSRLGNPTATEPKRRHTIYEPAAEISLSQMRYRYGASVDDILAYTHIGREFDNLCQKISPGHSAVDFRLAALHVRKSRYCEKNERTLFDSLTEKKADRTLTRHESLKKFDPNRFRGMKGIVGLVEESEMERFIYLTGTRDVAETVRPFIRNEALQAVGNSFWKPSLSDIHVYTYGMNDTLRNAPQLLWTNRLISLKTPIFNHPIHFSGQYLN